jgi:Ca2+-binding EF-hand superfamily protein
MAEDYAVVVPEVIAPFTEEQVRRLYEVRDYFQQNCEDENGILTYQEVLEMAQAFANTGA